MDERAFDGYDPHAFPPMVVAVDVVLLAVVDRALRVLLFRRLDHAAKGQWALPSSLLRPDEDLTACAARTSREKAGVAEVSLHQFAAFGAPRRDPRLRIVSIGYLGLTIPASLVDASDSSDRLLGTVRWDATGPSLRDRANRHVRLAFDHDQIVLAALERLRADLDRTTESFALLPAEFTLRELQIIHEAIRGEPVNKPAFRKRMLDSGRLEPVGRKDTGGRYRPAELYRLRRGAA